MAYTESQPYSVLSVNWSPNLAFDRASHCSSRWKLLDGAVYGRTSGYLGHAPIVISKWVSWSEAMWYRIL